MLWWCHAAVVSVVSLAVLGAAGCATGLLLLLLGSLGDLGGRDLGRDLEFLFAALGVGVCRVVFLPFPFPAQGDGAESVELFFLRLAGGYSGVEGWNPVFSPSGFGYGSCSLCLLEFQEVARFLVVGQVEVAHSLVLGVGVFVGY